MRLGSSQAPLVAVAITMLVLLRCPCCERGMLPLPRLLPRPICMRQICRSTLASLAAACSRPRVPQGDAASPSGTRGREHAMPCWSRQVSARAASPCSARLVVCRRAPCCRRRCSLLSAEMLSPLQAATGSPIALATKCSPGPVRRGSFSLCVGAFRSASNARAAPVPARAHGGLQCARAVSAAPVQAN